MSDIRRKDPRHLPTPGSAAASRMKPSRIEAVPLIELGRLVEPAIDTVIRGPGRIDFELPDLDGDVDADVIPDNIRAVAAIYFAATLENLKLFAVADTITEQFMTGAVPLSTGPAGEAIYRYHKESPQRLGPAERADLYARTVNQDEFRRLWIDFLAGVSGGGADSAQKAGRALAEYASVHGAGVSHFAAVELQALVREILALLDQVDLLAAYGVRDRWQLVERVSALYLGGSANGQVGRTKAQAGSQILLWLAAHAAALRPGGSPPFSQIEGDVARWLAVAGVPSESQDP